MNDTLGRTAIRLWTFCCRRKLLGAATFVNNLKSKIFFVWWKLALLLSVNELIGKIMLVMDNLRDVELPFWTALRIFLLTIFDLVRVKYHSALLALYQFNNLFGTVLLFLTLFFCTHHGRMKTLLFTWDLHRIFSLLSTNFIISTGLPAPSFCLLVHLQPHDKVKLIDKSYISSCKTRVDSSLFL